ncbi:hypothetical protein DLM75_04675 [Leptospira stimsonii]|uniref:Uncharacterized protein n=1 Tax=Leptospira stimsonii TaxID=2202203 RepID=A0A396ZD76_9LEPT|nr:hypothetical protein DLM75_04675 [Leptospira stimsonii]
MFRAPAYASGRLLRDDCFARSTSLPLRSIENICLLKSEDARITRLKKRDKDLRQILCSLTIRGSILKIIL